LSNGAVCAPLAQSKKEIITREMIDVLRPATPGAILPYEIEQVLGKKALVNLPAGKELRWVDLGE